MLRLDVAMIATLGWIVCGHDSVVSVVVVVVVEARAELNQRL